MNRAIRLSLRQTGYSLIELMVAMVLGLVLMGGVIQIYLSSTASYRSVYELARMQETARIVFDTITSDIRGVGYWGCAAEGGNINIANSVEDISFDPFAQSINGWRIEAGAATSPPGRYIVEEPLDDTDIIEFNYVDQVSGLGIDSHNGNAASLQFNNHAPFEVGDVMAVVESDCTNMGIFSISGPNNLNNGANNVVHNTGNNNNGPDNCTKALKGNFTCGTLDNSSNASYSPGSMVYQFTRRGYFVGAANTTPDTTALYRLNIGRNEVVTTVEVIQGVSAFDIDYVVQDNGQTRYLGADAIHNDELFSDVTGIRIRVGVRSEAPISADGNRLERDYSTVVAVRNRL